MQTALPHKDYVILTKINADLFTMIDYTTQATFMDWIL